MKISASYWMFGGVLEAQKPIAGAMQEARRLGLNIGRERADFGREYE